MSTEDPMAVGIAILARLSEMERNLETLEQELAEERSKQADAEPRYYALAEGVWLVEARASGHSSQRILKVGELPDPLPFAAVARHQDAITAALVANRYLGLSAADLAMEVVRAIAAACRPPGREEER